MKTGASLVPRDYLWAALAVAALVAAFVLLQAGTPASESTSAPGPSRRDLSHGAAPAFTLAGIDGRTASLAEYRGKVVVLNFWATWCPPCRREIPDFISLQAAYGPKGLQIVGIALDEPEKVEAFSREAGINYPVLLGTEEITVRYGGISGIPTTFIIDRDGNIVTSFEGQAPRDVFEHEIRKVL